MFDAATVVGMATHLAVLVDRLRSTLDELVDTDLDAVGDATVLADALVDLLGAESRLQAVSARIAGKVDASRVWANDGSRSCAAWLGRAAGRDRGDAAEVVARGRALRDMPGADAAHAQGRLSARHVRLLATAQKTAPEAYADDEEWLLARAHELNYADFARVVNYWCHCTAPDDAEDAARRRYEKRSVKMGAGIDGTGFIDVDFEAVGYATFAEALRRIEHELWEQDWAEARDRLGPDALKRDLARSDAQRRYDALIEMARRSAAAPAGSRKPIPLITVHVDHETLAGRICELSTGTVLTPGEVLPLLTEADIERAVFDSPSRIVDLGRTQRFFVGGTRRAVEIVHPTCTHATCTVPAQLCHIDHIVDWEDGGPTDHANGQPRCGPHHPKARQKSKARKKSKARQTSKAQRSDESRSMRRAGEPSDESEPKSGAGEPSDASDRGRTRNETTRRPSRGP